MKSNSLRLAAGIFLALGIGTGAFGVFLWKQTPPLFQSEATVRVVPDETDQPGPGTNAPTATDTLFFLQNESQAIRSDLVLYRVITNLNLTVAWGELLNHGQPLNPAEVEFLLKKQIFTFPLPESSEIKIIATSPDQNKAPELANAVAQAYCAYRIDRRHRSAQEAIDLVADNYRSGEERVDQAQAKLESARLALDSSVRELNPPPRANDSSAVILRERLNRLTITYLAQSNQVVQLADIDTNTLQRLQAEFAKVEFEYTNTANSLREEMDRQETLRNYWDARQNLQEAQELFDPIEKLVAEHRKNLGELNPAPAVLENPAANTTPLPTRPGGLAQACLGVAGVLVLVGIALFRSKPAA